MARLTRRVFLMSAAALAGCRSPGSSDGGPQGPEPPVRQPSVGQSWRYAKRDAITQTIVDNQIDTVSAVDSTVEIESRSEGRPQGDKFSWGGAWLKKYVRHHDNAGPLPSEIQQPWGRILVDPHWSEVQVYETAIPLWPTQLRPGWSYLANTKYKTPSNESGLPWAQTMTAQNWESISVPGGRFKALRVTNLINFRSADLGRSGCQRQEIVWFVPEIGRWAARQCKGTYYYADSLDDSAKSEASYRWELLSYT